MQKKKLNVNDVLIVQGKQLDKEVKAKTEEFKQLKETLWKRYGDALLDKDTNDIELVSPDGNVKLSATRSCSYVDCPELQVVLEDASFPVKLSGYTIKISPAAYGAVHKVLKDSGMLELVDISPAYTVDKYGELIQYKGVFADMIDSVINIATTKKVTF